MKESYNVYVSIKELKTGAQEADIAAYSGHSGIKVAGATVIVDQHKNALAVALKALATVIENPRPAMLAVPRIER